MPNIDVHTHIVPHNLPNDSGRSEAWPSIELRGGDNAAVMVRGKVFRAIDSRSWNVARRLDDMGADGIDVQVLSPMPELLSHWLSVDEADDLSKIMNDEAARMIATAPGKFRAISMVRMQDPELAARRLEDIRAMGLLGIEIGTHINGIPLGDERLDPVYAAAEALGASAWAEKAMDVRARIANEKQMLRLCRTLFSILNGAVGGTALRSRGREPHDRRPA